MKDIDELKYQKISNPYLSDKILADFIDDKLSSKKRGMVLGHLIDCNVCSDIVAIVTKNIKKK